MLRLGKALQKLTLKKTNSNNLPLPLSLFKFSLQNLSAKDFKMRGQTLTEGKIPRQIWTLAWPIMLSFFFQTAYNLVDALWVGRLSGNALAAVNVSQITLFIVVSLGLGITVGSGVLIAMSIGAGEKEKAEKVLGQAFVLSAVLAVAFSILALSFRSSFLRMSGATGAIFPLAMDYFTVVSAGSILLFLLIVIVFAFNSQGDNKTVTILFAISTAINAVLDPILIFGWIGAPALGVAGAAYATLFSQFVMLIVGILLLSSPKMMIRFHFRNLRAKWKSVRKVLSIGFPAAMTQVLGPLSLALLYLVISSIFREEGVAGISIGFRVETFAFLPGIGFGTAAMAIIGQNVGARNFQRAKEAYKKAALYAFLAGSAIGLISVFFSRAIAGSFTTDPTITGYAASYLVSVPLTYGFLGLMFVSISSFQATGKSWPGFWILLTRGVLMVGGSLLLLTVLKENIHNVWGAIMVGTLSASAIAFFSVRARLDSLVNEPALPGGDFARPAPEGANQEVVYQDS
jgi:putative MATE family efflux protein